MIVKLRRKYRRYPDLTPGQQYVVIGIEADDFRILEDFFDGKPKAVATFWRIVNQRLAVVGKVA
jgi:hypothetical protein